MINPDEMSVLSRTYFIAGLHLVNCKVVGYDLPAELPDELMLSAAAVGRITVPPRPVQGPNTIVASPSPPQPTHSHVPDKAPMSQGISSFMPNYSLSFSPPESSEIYQAYPVLPSTAEIEQQRQQIQQQEPMAMYHPAYQAMSPPLASKPFTNEYANVSHNSSAANSNTVVRPGPHAVHNMGMESMYYDEEPQRDVRQSKISTTTSGAASRSFTTTTTTTATPTPATSNSSSQASQVAKVENSYSIQNVALYASPPDAWDHDAAAPELDVEGNYIKYRCKKGVF